MQDVSKETSDWTGKEPLGGCVTGPGARTRTPVWRQLPWKRDLDERHLVGGTVKSEERGCKRPTPRLWAQVTTVDMQDGVSVGVRAGDGILSIIYKVWERNGNLGFV